MEDMVCVNVRGVCMLVSVYRRAPAWKSFMTVCIGLNVEFSQPMPTTATWKRFCAARNGSKRVEKEKEEKLSLRGGRAAQSGVGANLAARLAQRSPSRKDRLCHL